MLAKLTSKNQLTLPKSLISAVGAADYFEVQVKDGQIILTPVRIQRADAVRSKLEELGLNEQDIADAVKWARQSKRRAK
ncbi:MAG: AbrB/MazE/SpoVT family DNA-binding domain-containing protein [Betaproteobacteria bacterium]|nr:MAG: AbrB/MazE/SpoVT family DNA-binding domain-containing protein [Betaproteobacteria bacterium]